MSRMVTLLKKAFRSTKKDARTTSDSQTFAEKRVKILSYDELQRIKLQLLKVEKQRAEGLMLIHKNGTA